jgi:microcystin degradation protein MlrC
MRIAIGEIAHETNTFVKGLTTVDDFRAWEWSKGQEIIAKHRGVRDYLGGMLQAAEALGIEAVPIFAAFAYPSGTIARETYETMRDELLHGLRQAGEIDAVCLSLHGAGVAEGVDDLEGELLSEVRGLVGSDVPIVVTLDLHGNLTEKMVEGADALLGVNYYPHTDSFERGVEAVELARRIVKGEVRPVMHLEVLPMMITTTTTNHGPAKEINERCRSWEEKPGIIDCTFFHGFPYTDIPHLGVSILAIADGKPELAREAAYDVARRLWERRQDFLPRTPSAEEAIRMALASEGRPIVINDTADNPGGGTPGDGTHLLRAMLSAELKEACFGFIYDPETAEQAYEAGVGATIGVRLGGKTDELHGPPIETEAYVKCLSDGRFTRQSPMGKGTRLNYGKMARLVIGDIDVIVSSTRAQVLDAEVFLLHGIDVSRYKIVALKSSQHFRAAFESVAARIIPADTPGLTTTDLTVFAYHRLRRPIWPLDEDATF